MNVQKAFYTLLLCIAIVFILIWGESIIVPFILGTLIWFIGKEIKAGLNKISFVNRYFPNWLKSLITLTLIFICLISIAEILTSNINFLAKSIDAYQPNLDAILGQLADMFNLDVKGKLQEYTGNLKFGTILRSMFSSISFLLSNIFMIVLYAIFVLLEEANFRPKLQAIFVDEHQSKKVDEILKKIGNSISSYFRLKTFISFITGFLSYIALKFIGVDAPEFWAFLIFIMNFIPTIGSLIGTIFPAIFCLFQFGTFLPCILVLSIVGAIQILVGYLLEPKLMGSSMNISPLVTILTLSVWGAIWGIIGMILSIPITVVAIIIFSQFEKTKPIAILLSEKGNIN